MIPDTEHPQALRTINALMDQDWAAAQSLRLPGWPRNHQKLYPSQLPYCGLRHLYERLTDPSPESVSSFTDEMFGNIGQGMHWAYQHFVGSVGNAVANWYCTGPRDEPHDEELVELKTFRKCPKCGRPMRHREVKLEDGAISGKADFLWLARTGEDAWGNLLMPLDIKSSDDDRIAAQVADPTLSHYPNRDHVYQIESYVPMVEAKLDRKVAGWVLHYIGRGKPFQNQLRIIHLVSDEDRAAYRERNEFYNMHHQLSLDVDHTGDEDPPNMRAYVKLVQEKPCKTMKEYERNFHSYFKPCPLRDSCFNRQRLEKVMAPLLENIL